LQILVVVGLLLLAYPVQGYTENLNLSVDYNYKA